MFRLLQSFFSYNIENPRLGDNVFTSCQFLPNYAPSFCQTAPAQPPQTLASRLPALAAPTRISAPLVLSTCQTLVSCWKISYKLYTVGWFKPLKKTCFLFNLKKKILMNLNVLFSTNKATYVKTCSFNLVNLYYYHIPTCSEHVSVVQCMFWLGSYTYLI